MAAVAPPARGARAQLTVAGIAVMLAAADTYVVVLVLTSIIGDVGIPINQLQRAAPIISGFLLGYVAVLPLLGRLSDLVGRRPVFLGCLAVFAAGSVITASAHALPAVVTGRTLQGLGGGGLVPVTLALVADMWAPGRRGIPLGVVGAAQELGSVLGPLYGAVIVTLSGWRAIFWVNVPLTAALAAAFIVLRRGGPSRAGGRFDAVGATLAVVAAVAGTAAIVAPAQLVDNYTVGALYAPLAGDQRLLTPIALLGMAALAAFLAWELACPRAFRPLAPLRRIPELMRRADWLGALLLACALGVVVVAFATADPSSEVIAPGAAILLPIAAGFGLLFVLQERRSPQPLVPFAALSDRAALGSLATNVAVGAALIAALVDVPIFARETAFPDSQIQAALVLVRLLVVIPLGAVIGGAVCERISYRATAAIGMTLSAAMFVLMARWNTTTLTDPLAGISWLHTSDIVLGLCGLGFGLAIAPVNAAILGAVRDSLHGLAAALVVVARSIGMLVGLSVLTAVGLHSFYVTVGSFSSPLVLCPDHPARCPAYDALVSQALVSELHVIFIGAAFCCLAAALIASASLRRTSGAHS